MNEYQLYPRQYFIHAYICFVLSFIVASFLSKVGPTVVCVATRLRRGWIFAANLLMDMQRDGFENRPVLTKLF